jgi:hypothetical protein
VRRPSLFTWLALVAIAAMSGLLVVFLSVDAKQRGELGLELGKGLIQLLVVVVVGAALKLLVDRYHDQQQSAEQNRQFRQDKYDRLVQATDKLRRVPILINANRSVEAWSEQMLAVIDANLALRMIKHQISSSRGLDEPPFSDYDKLVRLLELMYEYTDWVTADFANSKKELSELQHQAEERDLSAQELGHRQDAVWEGIRKLESIDDMYKGASSKDRKLRQDSIEEALNRPTDPDSDATWRAAIKLSWVTYEAAESLALQLITHATLTSGRTAAN